MATGLFFVVDITNHTDWAWNIVTIESKCCKLFVNLNSLFSREKKTNHCLCCSIGVPSTTWPSTENHAVCLQFTWSWSWRGHHLHHMIIIIITWSSLLSRDRHHHHVIIVITWTSSSSRNYHHHVIVIIITWSSSSPRDLIMLIIIMGSKSSSWWSASISLSLISIAETREGIVILVVHIFRLL